MGRPRAVLLGSSGVNAVVVAVVTCTMGKCAHAYINRDSDVLMIFGYEGNLSASMSRWMCVLLHVGARELGE